MSIRSLVLALLAVGAGAISSAQEVHRYQPARGPLRNAGTFHLATGTWARGGGTHGILLQDVLFRNDRPSGYFAQMSEGEVFFDEARLPGFGAPLIPGQPEVGQDTAYVIRGFQFAYCAMDPVVPASAQIGFRERYAPCNNPSNFPEAASFDLTGLPIGGCWLVAIDLSGSSAEFTLLADGDSFWDNDEDLDNMGWSISIDQDQGMAYSAGPFLMGDNTLPLDEGNGTVFKNPASLGTGLGTEDRFWLESPFIQDGCFFFGGCLPCANFGLSIFGEGENAGAGPCGAGSPNSVSALGATLASAGGFLTANASFLVSDVPNQPGILFSGPSTTDLPFGCGRRCVTGAGIVRYGPFTPAINLLDLTVDMTVSSNDRVQYWYRDPAAFAFCGDVFNLSNSYP